MEETLQRFDKGKRLTAKDLMPEIAGDFEPRLETMNMRLLRLMKMGFLDRERDSGQWRYFKPKK